MNKRAGMPILDLRCLMDLQYAAGFFDGEGCILIGRTARSDRTTEYYLYVNVVNTDRSVLEAFQAQWDGRIYQTKGTHKTCWQWNCSRQGAARFLREVRPYLLVKGEQADLGLAYYEETSCRPGYRLMPDELAIREGYYLALREAKR